VGAALGNPEGTKSKFMQDSLGAAKGPRCGLIDANGSRFSILHSIDLGDGVDQRLGPNGSQQQAAGYPALLEKHDLPTGHGRRALAQDFSVRSAVNPMGRRFGAGGFMSSRMAERMAAMASS